MTAHRNVSGTWMEEKQIFHNNGGSEKEIKAAYRRVSGVWKNIFNQIKLDNFSLSGTGSSDPVYAFIIMSDDGTYTTETSTESGGGDWMGVPSSSFAGQYEVRLSKSSGTDPESGTLATWQALSASRTWEWDQHSAGSQSFSGTMEIRNATTQVVIASSSVSISLTFT